VIFSERTVTAGPPRLRQIPATSASCFSPGFECHIHPVIFYADAEFPVYQNFTGYQLAAPVLFKASLSFMF